MVIFYITYHPCHVTSRNTFTKLCALKKKHIDLINHFKLCLKQIWSSFDVLVVHDTCAAWPVFWRWPCQVAMVRLKSRRIMIFLVTFPFYRLKMHILMKVAETGLWHNSIPMSPLFPRSDLFKFLSFSSSFLFFVFKLPARRPFELIDVIIWLPLLLKGHCASGMTKFQKFFFPCYIAKCHQIYNLIG